VARGKVYLIGGDDAAGVELSLNEEYDPGADTWTTRAPMPTPRNDAMGAAVAGKVYVIGGSGGPGVFSANEQFDPAP
jgi:N-acetylneuraminic acid mutarotase